MRKKHAGRMTDDGKRIIVKYPNRRLYDTKESRYICIRDVVNLVKDQIQFVVVEFGTDSDITRRVLFDTLRNLEQERSTPVFSTDQLVDLIRKDHPRIIR